MNLSSEDIAYLREAAARDGYNPDDALRVFNYESSNRPGVWGGKGGKYFGLFQAGPSERAQFGIDTVHPSARNQIDAFGKFLHARGFKPTMGLLDMYSTVNAGSPGHYKASDGNGTVSSHVAKMLGAPVSGAARPAGLLAASTSTAPTEQASEQVSQPRQEEDLSALLQPPTQTGANLSPAMSALQQTPEVATDPQGQQMLQQMMDYHKQMHALAVKGLI